MHKMLTVILLQLLCCSLFKFWSATDHTGQFHSGSKRANKNYYDGYSQTPLQPYNLCNTNTGITVVMQ